jgi:hypothetical protein
MEIRLEDHAVVDVDPCILYGSRGTGYWTGSLETEETSALDRRLVRLDKGLVSIGVPRQFDFGGRKIPIEAALEDNLQKYVTQARLWSGNTPDGSNLILACYNREDMQDAEKHLCDQLHRSDLSGFREEEGLIIQFYRELRE